MKKIKMKLLFLCIGIVLTDFLLGALEYRIFTDGKITGDVILLGTAFVLVLFLGKPILEGTYHKFVRRLCSYQMPAKRAELAEKFAATVNNAYYEKEYLENMHLQKLALEKYQSHTQAKYELIIYSLNAAAYMIVFSVLYPEYLMIVAVLTVGTAYGKYLLERKQINYFIGNVPEDKEAEYYRNALADPEVMHDVKILGKEESLAQRSVEAFCAGLEKRYQLRNINAVVFPLLKAFSAIFLGIALFAIAHHDGSDLREAMVALTCIVGIMSLLDPYCEALFQFRKTHEIAEIANREKGGEDRYRETGIRIDKITSLRFEQVSFHYGDGRLILKDISFSWDVKDVLSIIGGNGAGKTTLIKLMLGINRPTAGTIFVNGIPMEKIEYRSYIRCIGACMQDYVVFEDSISENIFFGRAKKEADNVKQNEMVEKLLAFLNDDPRGMDVYVGSRTHEDGVNLSTGQCQRVALCRTLERNCSMFVLDEPTASFDPEMEGFFFQAFQTMAQKKPTILITHRIGYADIAKRMIVLDKGRIVEDGTREQLLQKKGQYYRMYHAQKEMYG